MGEAQLTSAGPLLPPPLVATAQDVVSEWEVRRFRRALRPRLEWPDVGCAVVAMWRDGLARRDGGAAGAGFIRLAPRAVSHGQRRPVFSVVAALSSVWWMQ